MLSKMLFLVYKSWGGREQEQVGADYEEREQPGIIILEVRTS